MIRILRYGGSSSALHKCIISGTSLSPGKQAEMLSVPQQTARYVKVHQEEVTEKERGNCAVLDYDRFRLYDPNIRSGEEDIQ